MECSSRVMLMLSAVKATMSGVNGVLLLTCAHCYDSYLGKLRIVNGVLLQGYVMLSAKATMSGVNGALQQG